MHHKYIDAMATARAFGAPHLPHEGSGRLEELVRELGGQLHLVPERVPVVPVVVAPPLAVQLAALDLQAILDNLTQGSLLFYFLFD